MTEELWFVLLAIGAVGVLFFILRVFVLWYLRLDSIADNLAAIRKALEDNQAD